MILVRRLFDFKDEVIEVSDIDEIFSNFDEIKDRKNYNFIIYKMGVEPEYQALILKSVDSKLQITFSDHNLVNYDLLDVRTDFEFNFHLNRFLNEKEPFLCKEYFEKITIQNKTAEEEKYKQWKLKYAEQEQNNKRNRKKLIVIGLAVLPLLIYIVNPLCI